MDINEDFKYLKEFYSYGLSVNNCCSYCSLMGTYTGEELKELFLNNDVISQYVEMFLTECYQARDLLVLLSEELEFLKENSQDEDMSSNMEFIIMYFNSLKNIADYCDSLQINSRAKNYFLEYKSHEEFNDKVLNILRKSSFRFKPSNGNEIFDKERKRIFDENEKMLENMKNNFFSEIFKDTEIHTLQTNILNYYGAKRNIINFDDEKQATNVNELCYYVTNFNLDSSDELLKFYKNSLRKLEKMQKKLDEIEEIFNSLNGFYGINFGFVYRK